MERRRQGRCRHRSGVQEQAWRGEERMAGAGAPCVPGMCSGWCRREAMG